MGMTHGNEATYPRIADVIGFCTPEQVVDVAEKVVLVQRDFGDRTDRKHARLKYTIDDHGPDWFLAEARTSTSATSSAPCATSSSRTTATATAGSRTPTATGTSRSSSQNGRVLDTPAYPMRTGLREIAKIHDGDFRLTANQNLIIANVSPAKRRRSRHCWSNTASRTAT